jgi:hypothetical protein
MEKNGAVTRDATPDLSQEPGEKTAQKKTPAVLDQQDPLKRLADAAAKKLQQG